MALASSVELLEAERQPTTGDMPPACDVVIYDGNCRFCTAQVKRLTRWDTRRRLAFVSLHDPLVAQRYPDLAHDELMSNMYVIDPRGGRHAGAAAIRYLSRRLPALWWLSPFLHLPGSLPLWQWLYSSFARIRYRFGRVDTCDNGACRVHFKS
ncbi:MAG: thiol-disulfide oxidoreductase DCC family protein [Pirellulales bacterium]